MERRLPAHPLIELIRREEVVQGRLGAFVWIEVLLRIGRPRAEVIGGGVVGSPRYSRMRWTEPTSVTKAMIRTTAGAEERKTS